VEKSDAGYRLEVLSGSVSLESIALGGIGQVTRVSADGQEVPFTQDGSIICLSVSAGQELRFEV